MTKLLVTFCVLFSVAFLATPVVAFTYFGLDHWSASIASSMVVGTLWIIYELIHEDTPASETPNFLKELFKKDPYLRSGINAHIDARVREISGFFGSEVAEFLATIVGAFLLAQLILRLVYVGFGPIEGWALFTIILILILIAVGVAAKFFRNRRDANLAAAEAAREQEAKRKEEREARSLKEAEERDLKRRENAKFLQQYLAIAPEWFDGYYLLRSCGEVNILEAVQAILTKKALRIQKLKADMERIAQSSLQSGKKKAAYDTAHMDFYKAALALQDINISTKPEWEAHLPKEPVESDSTDLAGDPYVEVVSVLMDR